ncbi:hypothetical protein TWF506_006147 [Arthrobotrys conoides]|uniref:Uncharacterized protein n=1 Tax=Arthrobotrys conoides TaxID=74498 RepID=A0AAN8PK78_9PEZI
MPTYNLCIVVSGDGTNPAPWQGSRWAFAIQNQDEDDIGDLLHVIVMDEARKWPRGISLKRERMF